MASVGTTSGDDCLPTDPRTDTVVTVTLRDSAGAAADGSSSLLVH